LQATKRALPVFLPLFLALSGCAMPWARRDNHALDQSLPAAAQQDDEGIPLGGDMARQLADRVTGQEAAAESSKVKLAWFGQEKKDEQVARAHFQEAERTIREKKYAEARASYEAAAQSLPNSPLHEDALFMVAETYFLEDKYPKAFTAYEELLNKYKRSRHLDTAVKRQFAIGEYWERRHQKAPEFFLKPNLTDGKRPLTDTLGRARRAFTKVRLNHPTGALADDSLMATANSFFTRGKYDDADYYYDLLRREYPNSDHQYDAHLLGVQAKIRRYQGPDYDGTPLTEAKELIEQTAKQFSRMPPEDRQRLEKMYGQVKTGLAQRDYQMAKYYERKGYYGAAKIYHERVVNDFNRTPLAEKANQRLADIKDKPPTPAPRFTWLSSLFPDDEEAPLKIQAPGATHTANLNVQ